MHGKSICILYITNIQIIANSYVPLSSFPYNFHIFSVTSPFGHVSFFVNPVEDPLISNSPTADHNISKDPVDSTAV